MTDRRTTTEASFRSETLETTMLALAESGCNPFVYYPQQDCLWIPAPVSRRFKCGTWLTQAREEIPFSFVHPDNAGRFRKLLEDIRNGVAEVDGSFMTAFLLESFTVKLVVTARDADGKPSVAVGRVIPCSVENAMERFKDACRGQVTITGEDDAETLSVLAAGLASQFYAIFTFDLLHDRYICHQDKFNKVLELLGPRGSYREKRETFINNFIHPDDREHLRALSDPAALSASFRDRPSFSVNYRGVETGWTRGTFMVLRRDASGRAAEVLFMAADISHEISLQRQAEEARKAARQDPLTGLLNRKVYDEIAADPSLCSQNLALMLIDIDHFKSINDSYGHEAGDEVLIRVGALVKSFFRSCDYTIRLGGDEIAVVLQDVKPEHWEVLSEKLPKLYERLGNLLPDSGNITLSAGIVFSDKGFSSELYTLADKALYHTKSTGRSGCTLINADGTLQTSWRNTKLKENFFLSQQELVASSMKMMFRNTDEVAFIKNADLRYVAATEAFASLFCEGRHTEEVIGRCSEELIDDQEMIGRWQAEDARLLSGQEGRLTTQEEGTKADGSPFVRRMTKYALSNAQGDVVGIFGVGFDITEEVRKEREAERTEEGQINRALANLYIAANYGDLKNRTFRIIAGTDASKGLHRQVKDLREGAELFIEHLVATEFRDKMRKFLDFDTLETRLAGFSHLGCIYLNVYRQWCRLNLVPVSYDEAGHLHHFLLMVSRIDRMQAEELEQVHSDHTSLKQLFAHVPGGLVMYRINPKTFEQTAVYVSPQYEHLYGNKEPLNVSDPNYSRLHPDDRVGFLAAVKQGIAVTHRLNRDFRVWNNATHQYMRVNLNAVAEPQQDGTLLVYALYSDVSNREDYANC